MIAFPKVIFFDSHHGSRTPLPALSRPIESWRENELEKTSLFLENGSYWITRADIGAVTFTKNTFDVLCYPKNGIDPDWFKRFVNHQWMPVIYHFWGFLVLHSSAVAHKKSGCVLSFAGPSNSGKSTIAFALGQREDWYQIADNALALRISNGTIELLNLPNEIRLRQKSAEHFGEEIYGGKVVDFHSELKKELKRIYFLEKRYGDEQIEIEKVAAKNSYPLLLQQSYALSLKDKAINRKMFDDYLTLAASVEAYKFSYNSSLDGLNQTINHLLEHSLT